MFFQSCKKRDWLDSHASTVVAEVERAVSVAPDVLLGDCAGLRFDLHLVGMVVAPGSAVASADGAFTVVGIFGQSWDCDCDGAAVTAGADWSVFGCHLSSLFSRDVDCEVNKMLQLGLCRRYSVGSER